MKVRIDAYEEHCVCLFTQYFCILPPHYTVTNIVTLFSFSVCWKKLQLKKSDLSQSFSMLVLDAIDISDGVRIYE